MYLVLSTFKYKEMNKIYFFLFFFYSYIKPNHISGNEMNIVGYSFKLELCYLGPVTKN